MCAFREYAKAIAKAGRKYQGVQNVDPQIVLEHNKKAFIDACLLDWENVLEYRTEKLEEAKTSAFPQQKDENGDLLMPFSKANATFIFNDLPDLYYLVSNLAADPLTFKEDGDDPYVEPNPTEAAKN